KQLQNKGLPPDANFATLQAAGYRDLYVFATDLNQRRVKEFSPESHPETPVAEAVRASFSIPLFFKAWQFSNHFPDDHIYVDGGLSYHDSLRLFDQKGKAPQSTLGLYLNHPQSSDCTQQLAYNEIYHYTSALFNTLLETQTWAWQQNTSAHKRCIRIDDQGWSATNFKMTPTEQQQLILAGQKAATQFLENYHNPA
ncbi:MAG: patatin-like phospholipase family protein, partial [Bacteroidota bacterium]